MTPLPRSEFAVTQRFIYLNHAAAGVLPLSSKARIDSFLREHSESGVLGTFPHDCEMPALRERVGDFVGAGGASIALLSNTSAAASAVATGLDWRPGDEVLLCDNEFPANAVPWVALRERGVVVRLLPTADERLTPPALRRALSARTRLVAVSWVSYADGYRHDLAGLAETAHAAGAFLCVDAMQGLGAFPLDVTALGVDAMFSGGAKWMLALHGIAVLYVCPTLRDRLALAAPGWRSLRDMWDFHNLDQPYAAEAMRFEAGTPNLVGAISLDAAVDLLSRGGPEAIAEHVLALTDRLCEGLEHLGAHRSSLRGEGVSSGIVTFSISGADSIELGRALERGGIITTYRTTGIRVSPHGYNTAEEIDALLDMLAALVPSRK